MVEAYFPPNYFDMSLIGAQADQNILKDILELKLPQLQSHLDDIGIEMCSFTLNWFLAIFFEVVPFTVSIILDCRVMEGGVWGIEISWINCCVWENVEFANITLLFCITDTEMHEKD